MHGRQQGVKSPPVSQVRDQHADEAERGLIHRLTAGDQEAFETVFQRYVTTALEERLAGDEIQRLIRDAIEQLPPTEKVVVMLSDLDGLADREIGGEAKPSPLPPEVDALLERDGRQWRRIDT